MVKLAHAHVSMSLVVFGSLFSTVILLNSGLPLTFAASAPNILPYQGRILNDNGVPIADATANMQFRLYDSLTVGTCLWSNDASDCSTDDDQVVTLTDGLFSEYLGDTGDGYAAILDTVFADNATVFLEVEINGEVLTPRKQIGAAAYALNADTLDGLDSASFTIDSEACLLAGGADCEMEPAGVTFPGVGASITTGTARFGDGVLYPALMIDGSASPNTAIGFGIDDYISFHGTQAEFVEHGGSLPPALRFYYDTTAEPQIISVHRVGTGESMWSLYGGASTDFSVMYGPTDGSDDTGALYFEATGASNVGTAHIGSYQLRNGVSTTPIACFSDDLGQSGAAPNRKACMMANTTFVLGQDVGSTDIVMAQAGFSKDSASTETITFTNPGAGVLDLTIDGGLTVDTTTLFVDDTTNEVGIGSATPDALLDIESTEDTERIRLTDTSNADSAGIYIGDGTAGLDGTLSAQAGSLFLDEDGKLWVNVNGATDWQDLTVAGGFDSTTIDNTTWSDGLNASNTWTFDVSGTDHTMVFGNGLVTFGDSVTVTDALTATGSFASNGTTTLGDAVTDNLTVAAAIQGANALIFDGATDNTNETTFVITDPSADNTITFKNETGTVAFLSDVGAGFDSTAVDNTTWSDGLNASNTWTFDVSGTDHTMILGNGLVTFGDSVTVTDALTSTGSLVANGTVTIGDAVTDNLTIVSAIQGANGLIFDGATDNTNETTFVITDPSADNTITFQNGSGTVAFLTDITGSFANTALSNLASVAINTSLLPGTDDSIDLGDDTHRWRDLYLGPQTLHIGTSVTDEGTIEYDTTNNAMVINEGSIDTDFRIEGNGNANLFFVDAGNDRIGIGDATPDVPFDVEYAVDSFTGAFFTNTSGGTQAASVVQAGNDNGNALARVIAFGSANANTSFGITQANATGWYSGPSAARMIIATQGTTAPIEIGTASDTNGLRSLVIGANAGPVVFNEDSSSTIDFLVETDNNTGAFSIDAGTDDITFNTDSDSTTDVIIHGTSSNLFFADTSVNVIGIGTGTPSSADASTRLDIVDPSGGFNTVRVSSTNGGTGAAAGYAAVGNTANVSAHMAAFNSTNTNTTFGITQADAIGWYGGTAAARMIIASQGTTAPIEIGTASNTNSLRAIVVGANAGPVVFNEDSSSTIDFRVETNGDINGIFVDADLETIDLVGGSGSTGCSISSAGALACSGAITSNGVGFWTLDGTAQTVTADKDITLSGGVNGLSFDGTTFSVDAQNNSIGIGTAAPGAQLQLSVAQPASVGTGTGTAATDALYVFGGTGGDTTIATTGTGGIGSDITVTAGNGGIAGSATTQSTGGDGGTQQLSGGDGGDAAVTGGIKRGGDGGFFLIDSGEGGAATGTGTSNTGGEAGWLMLLTANGGDASGATSNTGGAGGTLWIISGDGGNGSTTGGVGGAIEILAGAGGTNANGGNVLLTPGSGNGTGIAGILDFRGAAVFNEAGANLDFRVESDTNANMIFVDASADSVGIGTSAPGATLDVDAADVTGGGATESILFRGAAQTIALADGTTRTNQRQNQFIAPTINGVAAGGTETVTNAATVYIDAAPSGSNITITNPYALWVDAGTARLDGTINAPSLTASRALFTDSSSNLSASGTSAMLEAALSDETGSGSVMMAIAPFISTSLQAASSSFDLLDATATTINFGGATTTLNLAGGSGSGGCTINSSGDLTCSGAVTGSGGAGANTALSNLASVAINTSLISDTTNTDDLGSTGIRWKDLWLAGTATVADVVASGDVAVNGADITTSSTGTVTLFNTNATAAGILGAATGAIDIAGGSGSTGVTITGNTGAMAITGNFTTADDAAVNGGDITTTAATGSLFHTGATSGLMFTAATGSVDIAGGSGSTGLTVTGNTGALAISGTLTAGGGGDFTGNLSTDGNTTIGDEGGDSVVSNAADWTFANDTDVILSGGVNGFSLDGTTFSIDATNNRVGIGTAAPAILFEVAGNGAVTGNLAVAGGTTAAEELDVTGQIQFDLDGTTDTTVGVCKDNADAAGVETNVEFRDCSSTPGDIAEWYETTGAEQAGDLVMIGDAVLEYDEELYDPFTGLPTGTTETYQAAIMERADTSRPVFGIVSTSPLQTMGEAVKEVSSHPQPIAISGRVPARVNDEGGAIAAGDPITSSSVPGVGTKATEAGMIVGYALEPHSGSGEGVIMVFVSPGYHGGGSVSTSNQASGLSGDLSALNMSGNIFMQGNQIIEIGRLAGMGGNWSIEEDGTMRTEGAYMVAIESYQGETVEAAAVLSIDHKIILSGTGTLVNGEAVISFEDVRAEFNDITSTTAPIEVVAMPTGPVSIYLAAKDRNGFTIRQIGGAESGVTFDWIVTAFRKDHDPVVVGSQSSVDGDGASTPPVDEVLVEEPPAEEPPAAEPSAEESPVEEPPADVPPAEEPPVDEPVVEEPVIVEPPVEEPPAEEPIVEEPPADGNPTPPPLGEGEEPLEEPAP